ncbi:2-polyprenyl-6-methoxyphenol hydroxylase-like FAD-dependent oxidoreductase [Advenella incenata]|uniref:2-polyprenyl-6-methoxyphenol hydroxylase-like FAD-dependent oxidoreductase n=1 Tax=Advenella incenata TaxID=267800 RepID=A0A4V2FSM9_9BURK|nr:NAD(P)-binding protein [Advenella incenata]RZT94855.1 2-polyprenyl-6-methoxyphenol hydroxylase-like FAD-dependent oxidoreductase [Advenella incenata]
MNSVQENRSSLGTAVVIGGSIAGCSAAAALHEQFDRVLVIDRDELPATRKSRKGAPHAYQFHALAVGGRKAMEGLFPGLTQQAIDSGVPLIDTANTLWYCSKFGFFRNQPSNLRSLLLTRQFLEWTLRNRIREIVNVEVLDRTAVSGLVAHGGIVTGVEVIDSAKIKRTIDADLIVDTSGRPSVAPDWLASLGYPRPVETTINAKWGYTTAYVRPGPEWSPPYDALYINPTVTGNDVRATRGAGMWAQEDNVWVLTAQGCAGDYPPYDEEGFRDFLGSFGRTEFLELLDKGEMVKPPVAWRNTTNRLRDFAGLQSRPERFIVLGDATAAFNPVYGQGMSSAAMGAGLLREELRTWFSSGAEDLTGFAEHFQKQLNTSVIQACWAFSTGSDLQIPGVEVDGLRQESEKSQEQEYVNRVVALATEDLDVQLKLTETISMVRGPEWMSEEEVRVKVQENWDRLGNLTREDNGPLVAP